MLDFFACLCWGLCTWTLSCCPCSSMPKPLSSPGRMTAMKAATDNAKELLGGWDYGEVGGKAFVLVISCLEFQQARWGRCAKYSIDELFCMLHILKHVLIHAVFPESGREGSFKKALSLKSVIKDCLQTSPKVLLKWWLSLKDCHQTSPKVLLKWWLSLKIVIKHRPKFYWSDGCLYSLSSNIAQSSTEVMAVFKDCHHDGCL